MKKIVALAVLCSFSISFSSNVLAELVNKKEKHDVTEEKKPPVPEKNWFFKHVTGTSTITSNYVFRGLSNSNNIPAVQGGLTYTWDSGVYFNLWGSNANLLTRHNHQTTLEFDAIFGITNKIGENFTYNFNFNRYNYPKAREGGYNEFIAVLTYRILTGTIGYTHNYFGLHHRGTYLSLGFAIPLPAACFCFNDLTFSGGMGRYFLGGSAGRTYNDYNLMIAKKIEIYTLSLQWTDTNRKNSPHVNGNYFIATINANF